MFNYKKLFHLKFTLVFLFLSNVVYADSHNLNEILELIQKDLKTLEKAVYSDSLNLKIQIVKTVLMKIRKMF